MIWYKLKLFRNYSIICLHWFYKSVKYLKKASSLEAFFWGRGLQGINGINIAIDKNNIGIDTFFFTTTNESEKKYKNRKMDECPHNAHFRKINGIINRLKPGK